MKVRSLHCSVLAALAVMALGACGESGPSRAAVVSSMTDAAVPARFAGLAAGTEAMRSTVEAWCAGGPAGDVTQAATEIRAGWYELVPFWFGPVQDRRSVYIVDPRVTTADIDERLAGTETLDTASLRNLAGADERGLQAIEYLVLADPDPRRCEYATGAAELVVEETAALAEDWTTFGPTLAPDDEAANDALRELVSGSLSAVQKAAMEPGSATAQSQLDGAESVLTSPEEGIAELLSDDTVAQLLTEFETADTMALERTITTQVAGELGISVNFSDADGDG